MERTQLWMALIALLVSAEVSLFAADTPEPVEVKQASGFFIFEVKTMPAHPEEKELLERTSLTVQRLYNKFDGRSSDGSGMTIFSGKLSRRLASDFNEDRERFIYFILHDFLVFDLDFEGGTWDQFGAALIEKLHEAYKTQLPPLAQGFMPAKLEISFEAPSDNTLMPRVGAIRKKACTLSSLPFERNPFEGDQLKMSSPADEDLNRAEDSYNRALMRAQAVAGFGQVDEPKEKDFMVKYDYKAFPKISIQVPGLEAVNTAYFNLNELPQRPNTTVEKAAADLAAMFEISWKLNSPIVFAKTRLHAETGMMILQGSSEEIKVAQEAFNVLTGKKPEKPNSVDMLAEKLGSMVEVLQRREEAKEVREQEEQKAKKEAEQEAKRMKKEAAKKAKEEADKNAKEEGDKKTKPDKNNKNDF